MRWALLVEGAHLGSDWLFDGNQCELAAPKVIEDAPGHRLTDLAFSASSAPAVVGRGLPVLTNVDVGISMKMLHSSVSLKIN